MCKLDKMAKLAQRAKTVKVHFKPLLYKAFSNLTEQLLIVQNPIPYLDFMHSESCKDSRTKNQQQLNNIKWNQYTVQKVYFLHSQGIQKK
jgi:hypothetical protein